MQPESLLVPNSDARSANSARPAQALADPGRDPLARAEQSRSLVERLGQALGGERVAYLQWKGNWKRSRWMSGEGDIDLLVHRSAEPRFSAVLWSLGFRRADPPPASAIAGIESHFGAEGRRSELGKPYIVTGIDDRIEISFKELPPLRFRCEGASAAFVLDGGHKRDIFYRREQSRGYEARGELWSPGYFRAELKVGQEVTLIASTEKWDTILATPPARAAPGNRLPR